MGKKTIRTVSSSRQTAHQSQYAALSQRHQHPAYGHRHERRGVECSRRWHLGHRPGVDITFSAPKSVSLQALATGDEQLIRAHDEAVRSTLDMIERDLLMTRVHSPATGNRERRRIHGMVADTIRHLASRNLDPQLHTDGCRFQRACSTRNS